MLFALLSLTLLQAQSVGTKTLSLSRMYLGYETLVQRNFCPLSQQAGICVSLDKDNKNTDELRLAQQAIDFPDCLKAQKEITEYFNSAEYLEQHRKTLMISPDKSLYIGVNAIVNRDIPLARDLAMRGVTVLSPQDIKTVQNNWDPVWRGWFVKQAYQVSYVPAQREINSDNIRAPTVGKCKIHFNILLNGNDALGSNEAVEPKDALKSLKQILAAMAKNKQLYDQGQLGQLRQQFEEQKIKRATEDVRQQQQQAERAEALKKKEHEREIQKLLKAHPPSQTPAPDTQR